MKIYVSSDWHLGNEQSNTPNILKFLESANLDANKIILCGDIFDEWIMHYQDIITTEPYKTVYFKLIEVAQKIPVILIAGNHDCDIALKLKIKEISVMDYYLEDRIYYCHGHTFDVEQVIGSPFYYDIIEFFPHLYENFCKTPAQLINMPVEHEDRCIVYHEILKFEALTKRYRYIVVGHSHDPIIEKRLVDCGDFVDHSTYVIIEDGRPKLIDL